MHVLTWLYRMLWTNSRYETWNPCIVNSTTHTTYPIVVCSKSNVFINSYYCVACLDLNEHWLEMTTLFSSVGKNQRVIDCIWSQLLGKHVLGKCVCYRCLILKKSTCYCRHVNLEIVPQSKVKLVAPISKSVNYIGHSWILFELARFFYRGT